MSGRNTSMGGDEHHFPLTTWNVVLNAKDRTSSNYKEKLEYLISAYWKPVYSYIRNVWRMSNEDAKDLTQEFFAQFFVEKNYLQPASPEKGRFRTFLKVSLKHFLIDKKRKLQTKKHGGGTKTVSFEEVGSEHGDKKEFLDPLESFDREWARTILTRSIGILRNKLIEEGKEVYFSVFERYDLDSSGPDQPSYVVLARELGIKDSDVRNYLVYARRLVRKIIRKGILEYVLEESEVEDELKYLLSLL
ncbi:MAG: sigma-70 family RNA polymerase sigma factor [Planctomycetes bacterium]|nr:sigma-70 family RNA polymerase sigma factor [Planctomycetota bacterium]